MFVYINTMVMMTWNKVDNGNNYDVNDDGYDAAIALCAESEVGILSTLYCSVCCTEQYIMAQYKLVSTCQ